ncbi:MAG: DUF6067 family protein [Verrucomicrobiae bacterium]|nr:DUF6067 family protein [Verrucomicrobiae bacterium]
MISDSLSQSSLHKKTAQVPFPWQPVRINRQAASVWHRDYHFESGCFPSRIKIGGRDVFERPAALLLNGTRCCSAIQFRQKNAGQAVFEWRTAASDFCVQACGLIEYDGMLRVDLEIVPLRQVKLLSLVFELCLHPEAAKLFHFWPGKWGSAYNSGKLPARGLALPYKPFIWLGNSDHGVGVFSETNQNWRLKNPHAAIQIIPRAKHTLLRFNLNNQPRTLEHSLKYSIGLQATPVKPFPKDWHKKHIAHVGYYGIDTQTWKGSGAISLTYPAQGHLDPSQGTIDFWASPQFNPADEISLPAHLPEMELTLRRIFRGIYARKILTVWLGKEKFAGLYWYVPNKCLRVYLCDGAAKFPVIIEGAVDWKEGQWHHVALSYGKRLELYADNRLIASASHAGLLPIEDWRDARIVFGGNEGCDFAINGIRIEKLSRSSFDLSRPPLAGSQTLLLDPLNKIQSQNGRTTTRPLKCRGAGGLVTGTPSLVPGKFDKSLMLCENRPAATTLDRLKEYGLNVIVFHEHWSDIQDYADPTKLQPIKKLAAACHRRGMKLMVYFGMSMSDLAPEWKDRSYRNSCLVKRPAEPIKNAEIWHRYPEQKNYRVCYQSKWQDVFVGNIRKVMTQYGVDGVYLDGTIMPRECKNHAHGCGYRDAKGEYQPTYPIFAVRKMMKRIYKICVEERGGMISAHQSTCNVTPTLAYATSYWDGEQFNVPLKGAPLKILPLETFQAEFMGRNHGLPAEFLTYAPFIWTVDEALTFTLLHDVLIRPINVGPMMRTLAAVWKVQDAFDLDEAKWIPYWSKESWVRCCSSNIKASYYVHERKHKLMLVVANFKTESTKAALQIRAKGFLSRASQAIDALTGERLFWNGTTLVCSLGKLSSRIIALGLR